MRLQNRTLELCVALAMSGGNHLMTAQQPVDRVSLLADNDSGNPEPSSGTHRDNRDSPRTTSTEPLNNCGDSLSEALQQGTPEFLDRKSVV